MTMRSVLRSVFSVNRSSLMGAFVIVVLATALLTASGVWIEAGWTAEAADGDLAMLSALGSSFAGTTLIIVIFIVASTVTTALRSRRREFALLRSIGATPAQVRAQVTAEVLVVVLAAAPVGALAGVLIAPALTSLLVSNGIVPDGFTLSLSPLPIIATLIVLVPSALLAGRLAARESAKLSPTAALQQSETEPAEISRGRLIAGLATAVAGVLVATTPLFVSGAIGAAAGASSVLLLIVAVALAGPVMIGWLAARAATAAASGRHPAVALAAVNARGFSRRHTAVILPLALLLSLGAVQSGLGTATTEGVVKELEQAVTADLVVPSSATTDDIRSISEMPGVISVAQLSAIRGSVHVDADETAVIWEPTAIRTLSPAGSGLFDPGVVDGALTDLAAENTIAVSRDALLFTGMGVGDSIGVRLSGEAESAMRIVAVYERSLGVGDYLISPTATEFDPESTAVLVQTQPDAADAVSAALSAEGLQSIDAQTFTERAGRASAAEQGLSNTLLLALLAFIAIAALQTLAMVTSGRRAEFDLLRRTGATRAQIGSMVAVEAVFVVLAATVLGVASAVPGLVLAGLGLLGDPLAAFDPVVIAGLGCVVLVLPVVTMISVSARISRPAHIAASAES